MENGEKTPSVDVTVGRNISMHRALRGMTEKDFVDAVGEGMREEDLKFFERGVRRPTPKMVAKMAQVFGIGVDELFNSPGNDDTPEYK